MMAEDVLLDIFNVPKLKRNARRMLDAIVPVEGAGECRILIWVSPIIHAHTLAEMSGDMGCAAVPVVQLLAAEPATPQLLDACR